MKKYFIAVLILVLFVIVVRSDRDSTDLDDAQLQKNADKQTSTNKLDSELVEEDGDEDDPDQFKFGVTKPVPHDLNAQVRSVHEALKTKKFPERLSPQLSTPFNLEAYKKDPQKYIDTIEPGRVFRPAQPGADVPTLARSSEYFAVVSHGEFVELEVEMSDKRSGQPVTFTSFDLGRFENQLTSINVTTNNKGIATTKFYGAEGTIGDVNILAASPMSSGRIKFVVQVRRVDGTEFGQLPKNTKEQN